MWKVAWFNDISWHPKEAANYCFCNLTIIVKRGDSLLIWKKYNTEVSLSITLPLMIANVLALMFLMIQSFLIQLSTNVRNLRPAKSYIFHGTSGIVKNLGWKIFLLGQHISYFQCNLFFIVLISPVVLKILKLQRFGLGRYKYIPLVKSDKFPYSLDMFISIFIN